MKKVVLNHLVIAALAVAAAFTSCGGGSGSGSGGGKSSGKIKMTTEEGGNFSFYLTGSGVATVDWGDGSEKVSLTLTEGRGVEFTNTYSNATIRTIIINGDNITGLRCGRITSLDVSRCTELTLLECGDRNGIINLTSLDVSKNTALTSLLIYSFRLNSLDVSKNKELKILSVENSQLASLDLSKNTVLERLDFSSTRFMGSALNDLFGTLHSNGGWVRSSNTYAEEFDRSIVEIAEKKGWTVQVR